MRYSSSLLRARKYSPPVRLEFLLSCFRPYRQRANGARTKKSAMRDMRQADGVNADVILRGQFRRFFGVELACVIAAVRLEIR